LPVWIDSAIEALSLVGPGSKLKSAPRKVEQSSGELPQKVDLSNYHSRPDSPVAILVDEAKSVDEDIFEALSRRTATYRLYASSAGAAFGYFYSLFTSRSPYWRTYRIRSTDCPHIPQSQIDADRVADGEHSATFKIKHLSEFLFDAGDSVISLEHVRNLLDSPPQWIPGPKAAFCDFAGSGDESALALVEGNRVSIVDHWRARDTMSSVGRFISWFRKLGLSGWMVGGDQGFGYQLMDRMAEQGYQLRRFNNGAAATRNDVYANFAAESWATVGQLIERKQIILPQDERLVAQLTSRRRLYDSRSRTRLESKADLKSRGCDSPDLADAVCGAVMMRLSQDRFAFDLAGAQSLIESLDRSARALRHAQATFATRFVSNFDFMP
jgi:phage terminase large subunit